MEMEIEKIKIVGNVRKDLGDLTELTASIKEKGVLVPLLISQDAELIAGHRRIQAAKAAGLKHVPVRTVATEAHDEEQIQMIENIQRKNLDPTEEGEAFATYMKETGHGKEHLAKMIGKKVDYIERRITLADLDPAAKKALKDKKIKLGHAVIMSRYSKKKHKSMIQNIEKGNYYSGGPMSVEEFAEELDDEHEARDLSDAKFDKTECSGCSNNGGHQSLLTDTEGHVKDRCLNPTCFKKKQKEYVQARIKELEGQNANVMNIEDIKKISGATEVPSWKDEHAAAKKSIYSAKKKSSVYAVAVDENGGEEIWRIADKKKAEKKLDPEDQHNLEMAKKSERLRKLSEKVSFFKTELLRTKGNEKDLSGLAMKRFLAWSLFDRFEYALASEGKQTLKEITKMTDKQLDKFVKKYSEGVFRNISGRVLENLASFVGVDLEKDFEINEEYLQLYTKDQLLALAKELKIDLVHAKKNKDIIVTIVQNWKKGQVPKILTKKLG